MKLYKQQKCGFPLAEERKKQKMFFSHAAGSLGSRVCMGSSGHMAFQSCLPHWLLHGWLGMVPSCVWKMNFENLLGLQFLQNPQYQCSLFQSFSSLSICSSLCICSVITYLYLLFMFRAIISMFYSVGWRFPLPVGRGTAIYGLYSYVPLWRVWFSSSLLWDRVYKSETWSWLNIIV